MKYGRIAGIERPVSRIILGGSSTPLRKGENSDDLFDCAINLGINYFDTARGYGKSEELIGNWLERTGKRDEVILQTKGALHGLLGNNRVNERAIRADFQKSLDKLKTHRIDIYVLHRDNPKTEVGWIVELLNEFKAEGKVKAFGGSNWSHTRLEEANEYAYKHGLTPMSVSQPHYSSAVAGKWNWIGCLSVTGEKNAEAREWYAKTRLPLTAFSPLANGFLSGRVKSDDIANTKKFVPFSCRSTYFSAENMERLRRLEWLSKALGRTMSQIALAWILKSEMNTFAIVGNG
ncbi:MAG: aldo/keto reductase, partial [Clostridia bacterium]|nr:aldo/keto reductase [Clostridia bacterium]